MAGGGADFGAVGVAGVDTDKACSAAELAFVGGIGRQRYGIGQYSDIFCRKGGYAAEYYAGESDNAD